MQLFEQKEYWEVFHKDDRNQKGQGNTNKRYNLKEQRKRMNKIQERSEMSQNAKKLVIDDSTDEEIQTHKIKKYTNGKPKKEKHVQTYYQEQEETIKSNAKKQAKKI